MCLQYLLFRDPYLVLALTGTCLRDKDAAIFRKMVAMAMAAFTITARDTGEKPAGLFIILSPSFHVAGIRKTSHVRLAGPSVSWDQIHRAQHRQ